jgi:hypothetical protein
MNKEVEIRFRVSKEEKLLIKQKAKLNKMKMSEYARYACLGTEIISTETITKITIK